jgi:SAM-dependent methyltransferase
MTTFNAKNTPRDPRVMNGMRRLIGFLLVCVPCDAFLAPEQPHLVGAARQTTRSTTGASNSVTVRKARSICTFDETDFTGKQGDWPYSAADLNRLDNSDDQAFYNQPRFVTHIDDAAIASLTAYYEEEFQSLGLDKKSDIDVLDLCSSWISHLPETVKYGKVAGVGMNQKELQANKQLTEYAVQDLNEDPSLSRFEDNSFDVICNVVSVDYLQKPLEIFQEMNRILRPGGICLMSFSNRCFPTKAIAMWLQADDIGRLTIVASYFHYSETWGSIEAFDIVKEKMAVPKRPSVMDVFNNPAVGLAWMNSASAVQKGNQGDPMFVVKGVKAMADKV